MMPRGVWTRPPKPIVYQLSETQDLILRHNNVYIRTMAVGGAWTETNANSLYIFIKEMLTTKWKDQL